MRAVETVNRLRREEGRSMGSKKPVLCKAGCHKAMSNQRDRRTHARHGNDAHKLGPMRPTAPPVTAFSFLR
jgi:hypothetical protein